MLLGLVTLMNDEGVGLIQLGTRSFKSKVFGIINRKDDISASSKKRQNAKVASGVGASLLHDLIGILYI